MLSLILFIKYFESEQEIILYTKATHYVKKNVALVMPIDSYTTN